MNESTASIVHSPGRPSFAPRLALQFGSALLGLVLISLGVWRMWSSVDATAARLLAIGALFLLWTEIWGPRYVYPGSEWAVPRASSRVVGMRLWVLLAGIGLSVAVDAIIFLTMPISMFDWTLLAGWLVSMLLVLAAMLPAPDRLRWSAARHFQIGWSWRSLWRSEVVWIFLITALAAAVRLLDPTLLYPVRGDEAYHRGLAQFFLSPPLPSLFALDYFDDSRIYYVPQRFFMAVFGDGLGPAREYAALWGVATIPPAYLLARELFGRRVAITSSLILAVLPFHVNYSRQNLPQPFGVAWTVISLYCLVRALRTGRLEWWIGLGLATGIAQYGHTDARFIPITIAIVICYELVRAPRHIWNQRYNIVSAAPAALLAYGPTFFFVIHNPWAWNSRNSTLNIFSSGWLAQQAHTIGLLNALADQISLNALPILTAAPAYDGFYPSGAMLPPWAVPFAVAGVIRCAVRWEQRGPFLLLAWAALVFVLGGIFVAPEFQSQHLIELSVPIALLAGLGIGWIAEIWPRRQTAALFTLTGILVASGVYYFFVQYPPLSAQGDAPKYSNDTMTEAGYFLHDVRPDAQIYFFDAPYLNYHAYLQAQWLSGDRTDVIDVMPEQGIPPFRLGKSGGVFLFLPTLRSYMTAVQKTFRGGRVSALRTTYLPGHDLALVYQVGHPLRAP